MRLRRSLLVLAAGLSAPLPAANITVDLANSRTITSVSDAGGAPGLTGNTFAVGGDGVLTIDLRNSLNAPIDATYNGKFLDGSFAGNSLVAGLDGTGTIVKAGGGTLQYNGFADMVYLANATFDSALNTPLPKDLRPLQAAPLAIPNINDGANQAFSGLLLVQQGQLQVSGHINQWADYGAYAPAFAVGGMLGARATVVENGAKISFRNTTANLVGASVDVDNPDAAPKTPLVGRLNYLNNPLATTASRIETGPDSDYILVLHADLVAGGLDPAVISETTVGILEGKGRVYKTGASDMRITNGAAFTGEFVATGGRLTLAAGSGDTLWSAKSVNLASGGNGTNLGAAAGVDWKPGYAPGNAGSVTLVVQGSQRLRNFQSLYNDAGFTTILQPGTGAGNFIELAAATDILTVDHETGYDGYFTGSVVGALDPVSGLRTSALGTLRKTGAGALALFSKGNDMSLLEILGGRVVASVESLGSGEVFIADGAELSIVQNEVGALRAVIRTETTDVNAELRFRPTDSILYRGAAGASLGNADEGAADIVAAQPFFYGRVVVEDGNDIVFSSGNNDAFVNASAIVLEEGASGRETSIRFNDTNQLVRNLQGAASTRIYLGRGDITLVNSAASDYAGGISGVGNLIKSGPNAFTLSGTNNYYGATVVQGGTLAATSVAGIGNTSGLILGSGAVFTGTAAQSVGSLFGRAGSTATFGGALTVGISSDLRTRLVTELTSLPGEVPAVSAAYYLATETSGVLPGFDFSPATTLGYLVRQYGLATDTNLDGLISEAEVVDYLDADNSGAVTFDELSAGDIAANKALLAFSGSLTLGGALTKVGAERLSLLGSVTFAGADKRVVIEGGTLEIALSTLSGASGVTLGDDGAIELAVDSASSLPLSLSGTGTFRKTGAADLRVDRGAGAEPFDGVYDLASGNLTVVFRPSSADPAVAREGDVATAAGTTFTAEVADNLNWAGEVYGAGNFTKTGAGVLTLTATTATGPIFTTGKVTVLGGGLVAGAVPEADLEIAAGASYTAALTQDDFLDGVLSGAGTFVKQGDFDLRLETAAPFAGAFQVEAGSLSLGATNALASASSVTLSPGTELNILDGLDQTLANVTAAADVTVNVADPASELTLNVAAGQSVAFNARIVGDPTIFKTGGGTLRFIREAPAPDNAIAFISVQAGELEASQSGLGGADINLGASGTLRFFAAEGSTETYAGLVVTGGGKIAKSGAGTVDLTGATLTTVASVVDLTGGTLVLSRAALGARLPTATLANGATLEFVTDADVALTASGISGQGNLTLAGIGRTITLDLGASGAPAYSGITTLRDGVTVGFVSTTGAATLGGLAAESGSTLSSAGLTSLAFQLDGATEFLGDVTGGAALSLTGDGSLDFTAGDTAGDLSGYGGTVTVDGVDLVLSTGNLKDIVLNGQGRLVLVGPDADGYDIGITGDGTGIVALGEDATIDLIANPDTSFDEPGVDRLELLEGSTLVMNLSGSSLDKSTKIALLGGALDLRLTTDAEELNLGALVAAPASTGGILISSPVARSLTITGDVSGDLVVGDNVTAILRGNLGGAVTVDAGGALQLGVSGSPVTLAGAVTVDGRLTGSGTAQGGLVVNAGATVAPGYSPGTVTVVGDFVNSGTLVMELAANDNDKILFSGAADLNNGGTGKLEIVRFGAGSLFGRRFVLFADTDLLVPATGSFDGTPDKKDGKFSQVTSTGADPLRILVSYPSVLVGDAKLASLAKDGEMAVYVVRADADYDTLLAGSPYLTTIKQVSKVDLDPVTGVSTLGADFTSFGARLAVLDDAALKTAVASLLPRGSASVLTGAVGSYRASVDATQRRLEQRRFDGADMSVKTLDWYVDATNTQTDLDNGHEGRGTGATAGLVRPLGSDGYWSAQLGVSTLSTSGGGATYKGNGFNLGVAGGVMNLDRTLALDVGLAYASVSGDLSRPSIFGGNNTSSPDATSIGAWVRASGATGLAGGFSLTPFLGLEFARTSMGEAKEAGTSDALTVAKNDLTHASGRLGFGINRGWVSTSGDWRYRLSLEVAYSLQFDGEDASLSSTHTDLGSATTNYRILPGDGLSLAPTFTFGTSPDSTFTLGARIDQGSEGEVTSLQFGYRRKF